MLVLEQKPDEKLHVSGGNILLDNNKKIKFNTNGITGSVLKLDQYNDIVIGDGDGSNAFNGHILFLTGGSQKMILRNNGSLGIGTNTPSEKLDVDGKIRMREGANDGYVIVLM